MGALEGQVTNNSTNFAESQLVDCNRQYSNEGCNGGFPDRSFEYLFEHRIFTSEQYPYHASDGACKREQVGPSTNWTLDQSYHTVRPVFQCCDSTGSVLADWLWKKGPVAVSVHAGQDSFRMYSGGVINENCLGGQDLIDHSVLAVGYEWIAASDLDEGHYVFLVKNSWGSRWGEQGFV